MQLITLDQPSNKKEMKLEKLAYQNDEQNNDNCNPVPSFKSNERVFYLYFLFPR